MQKQHGRQKMEGGERERARERERRKKNSPDLKKFCRQKKKKLSFSGEVKKKIKKSFELYIYIYIASHLSSFFSVHGC